MAMYRNPHDRTPEEREQMENWLNTANQHRQKLRDTCREIKSLFFSNQLENLDTVYNEYLTNPDIIQKVLKWSFNDGTTSMDDQFISYMVNMYHFSVYAEPTDPGHKEIIKRSPLDEYFDASLGHDITDQYVDDNYVLK